MRKVQDLHSIRTSMNSVQLLQPVGCCWLQLRAVSLVCGLTSFFAAWQDADEETRRLEAKWLMAPVFFFLCMVMASVERFESKIELSDSFLRKAL